MDLISIRRKYSNIRNIIIFSFAIISCIIVIIGIRENLQIKKEESIYLSDIELLNVVKEYEEQQLIIKIEEEKTKKLPVLTEEGINNVKNIYKSETKRVFLTFDDGPSSTVTPVILDILKSENIKATFFLLGSRVELNPEIVKREYEEGHFIASHGYSHVYSQIYTSPQSVLDEYNSCIRSIQNAIGVADYNPHLFRFPGGYKGGKYENIKIQAHSLLEQNNITHVDWNALTADSAGAKNTEEFIAQLEKTVPKYNSVVVLMHDAGNKKATAEALPTIISYFRDRGYEFKSFYDIIK